MGAPGQRAPIFEVTPEGLVLKEIAGDTSIEEVLKLTEADLTVAENCCVAEDF